MSGRENSGNAKQPRIGILTFHYSTNYGAVLQAYALSKFITAQGYDNEIVDYRQISAIKVYVRQLFGHGGFFSGLKKVVRFQRFIYENLPLSKRKAYFPPGLQKVCEHYDVLIVGSDEVWKTQSFRGFDPSFFLNFAAAKRKISFSASVGGEHDFSDKTCIVRSLLMKFDAISVRDDLSSELLKKECGIPSIRLIDPTFLVNLPELLVRQTPAKRYIAIYGLLEKSEMAWVESVAADLNLCIVSVGYRNEGSDETDVCAGVDDWLAYLRDASVVVTTFFHGVIFALKFHKKVFVPIRAGKNYKIDQLITDFCLNVEPDVLIEQHTGKSLIRLLRWSDRADHALAKWRNNAKNFISVALNDGSHRLCREDDPMSDRNSWQG